MKNKIIFFTILFLLIFPAFSASAYVSFDHIFGKVEEQVIEPMKQKFNSFKNKDIVNEIQEKAKEKQEELIDKAQIKVKETIKEKTKSFIKNKMEWVKSFLNPLKIKIQEGTDIIKREFDKLKNYLKDLF